MSSSTARPRPSSTEGSTLPWTVGTILTARADVLVDDRIGAGRAGGVQQIALRQDDQVGAGDLVLEHFLDRIVMVERLVGGALRLQARPCRRRPGLRPAPAPSTTAMTPSTVTRLFTDGHWKAWTSGLGRARPEVSIRMWSTFGVTRQDLVERRDEIVGDGAADAAIGQFDDVFLRAGVDAAALQDLAVDADIAELVDDDGQPLAARRSRADGGSASSCRRRGSR